MPELRIKSSYLPLPRQVAFHSSPALIRGYGGAMAGGKSRAICEDVFQDMLDYPGIQIPVFRQRHVSITETTKRTFKEQVLPPELYKHCDRKASGGEDYIRLPNGSTVFFFGLEDPVRYFSAEFGGCAFDEAHEMAEEDVVKVMSRLRQAGMPCRVRFSFNPENPGHWLYQWFIAGAERTYLDGEYLGYRKRELFPSEATKPLGDAEFVFAKPTDNPYIDPGYVERYLGGMPELLRRRYLEGEWIFTSGLAYFDPRALTAYADRVARPKYRFDWEVKPGGDKAGRREHDYGNVRVYAEPVEGREYAVGCDVATGVGRDFSTAYVVDLGSMEFVAEFHGKIDPDLYAAQLHFLGRWYNTALVAVESAGGWGEPVIISLRDGKGGRPPYPRLYRHQLSSQVDLPTTKRFGYPMNSKTRPVVLAQLAKALREEALPFVTERLLDECNTFVHMDTGTSPRAQDGCHDDCVMAASVALEMYRQKGRHPDREARIARRRRVREKVSLYPWQRQAA